MVYHAIPTAAHIAIELMTNKPSMKAIRLGGLVDPSLSVMAQWITIAVY
jgi:hypothetical protein